MAQAVGVITRDTNRKFKYIDDIVVILSNATRAGGCYQVNQLTVLLLLLCFAFGYVGRMERVDMPYSVLSSCLDTYCGLVCSILGVYCCLLRLLTANIHKIGALHS